MTGRLRFDVDWVSAPGVRIDELAHTWARLSITVDDIQATLVEERTDPHGVRKSLDTPAYPLAEWLAVNWWTLRTSAHRPDYEGVRLVQAGNGFAWPDISLRSDRGLMWIDVRRRDRDPEFVKFLNGGRRVLDLSESLVEIERFVDATVRRLDEAGVSGTLLQEEWAAIHLADDEEQQFCLVASAWGFDPYEITPEVEHTITAAGHVVVETDLLVDLARAVDISAVPGTEQWLADAVERVHVAKRRTPLLPPVIFRRDERPWHQGYRRARELRERHGLELTERMPVDELVGIAPASEDPPQGIDALVRIDVDTAGVVVAPHANTTGRRFLAARALGRRSIEGRTGYSLLTRGNRYSDRVERAFAAELLAPADGISALIGSDDIWSETAQQRAADHFRVSPKVIEHQVENRLAA